MVQGLCLGGEYGGAIPYVAEHVSGERLRLLYRLATNLLRRWEIVVVAVVLGTRGYFGEDVFNAWAWRVPFPVSFLPCNLRAGSTTTLKMIGILVVAALSAVVAGVARQAITSGAKAANSAAAGLRAEASAPRSRCRNPRQRIDRCPQQADGISHGSPWLCGW
jgi:MFS family permease